MPCTSLPMREPSVPLPTPPPPNAPHRDVLHLTAWHFAISTKDIFLLYLRKCAYCQIKVEELWSEAAYPSKESDTWEGLFDK